LDVIFVEWKKLGKWHNQKSISVTSIRLTNPSQLQTQPWLIHFSNTQPRVPSNGHFRSHSPSRATI